MRPGRPPGKSRGAKITSSPIATRTRKFSALTSATSRKRLRRLRRVVEEDDDDDEEELSPGSTTTSSSISEKRKNRGEEKGGAANFENPSCFVEFDGVEEVEPAVFSQVCERDFDQQPFLSDEMDQVQFELEKQLALAVCTQRKLRSALHHLTTASSYGGGNVQSTSSARPSSLVVSGNKRKFPRGQQFARKPAASSSSSVSYTTIAAKRNRAAGTKARRLNHEPSTSCSRSYYYAQQNHQMPDKFWSYVDQYTSHTSLSTVAELLRDLIRESDPDLSQSYYEMPENKHAKRRSSSAASPVHSPRASKSGSTSAKASQKGKGAGGSKRDQSPQHEETAGRSLRESDSATTQTRKRSAATTAAQPTAKKSKSESTARNGTVSKNTRSQSGASSSDKNAVSIGPLTERLVQALIEECGSDGMEAILERNGQADTKSAGSTSANSNLLMKTLNLGNLKALETRIKKELIDQGLLDSDDQPDRKPLDQTQLSRRSSRASVTGHTSALGQFEECADDDEVTAELKRRQYELLCLQRRNHERLTSLLEKVESRIDIVQKDESLRAADDEVLDLCARYYGVAPTSRKPSNKKERDSLWKALKDREKALQKVKNVH